MSGECDSTVYMDIYCHFNLSNIPKTNYLIATFKDIDITCFVVHCSYFFDVNIEYQCQFSRQLKLQIGKKINFESKFEIWTKQNAILTLKQDK